MSKKVAIYIRVSTAHQKTDLQENDLLNFVSQRNFHIFNIYKDQISGSKEKRPALDQLISDSKKRFFDAVIVWRFDRFARSTKHLSNALDEFNNLGIDFISYQENIDTSSPMGKAMFTIISAMAQLERDIIKERVVAGIRAAKQNGKKLGRPKKSNDLLIKKLREEGLSYRSIAKQLNISLGSVQYSLNLSLKRDVN